jgi:ABC-type uncharacterized transport system permease subunit
MLTSVIAIFLSVLCVLSLLAAVAEWVAALSPKPNRTLGSEPSGQRTDDPARPGIWRAWFVVTCGVACAGMFLVQALWGEPAHDARGLLPLRAHLEGLLLLLALLCATVAYLQSPARLPGVRLFALPLVSLLLGWSICASQWTRWTWPVDSAWKAAHLGSVYLGGLCICVAAISGGLYLHAAGRLRSKRLALSDGQRPASLEATERRIVAAASLGFGLLSLGLISGLVLSLTTPRSGVWWVSPKIALATALWLIFALVANLGFAQRFRGHRAAWLSIAGFVLMLVTFSIATALPEHTPQGQTPATQARSPRAGQSSTERPNTSHSNTLHPNPARRPTQAGPWSFGELR